MRCEPVYSCKRNRMLLEYRRVLRNTERLENVSPFEYACSLARLPDSRLGTTLGSRDADASIEQRAEYLQYTAEQSERVIVSLRATPGIIYFSHAGAIRIRRNRNYRGRAGGRAGERASVQPSERQIKICFRESAGIMAANLQFANSPYARVRRRV